MPSHFASRSARIVAWGALLVGVLAAALAVALTLGRVPATGAIVGVPAVVAAVSLVLSAVVFLSARNSDTAHTADSRSVTASGPGAVAAGRDASGNAVGMRSSVQSRHRKVKRSNAAASDGEAIAPHRDVTGDATGKTGPTA